MQEDYNTFSLVNPYKNLHLGPYHVAGTGPGRSKHRNAKRTKYRKRRKGKP